MKDDYKLLYEQYQKVNEAGFSYARNYSDSTEQPKKQLAHFKRPKRDNKNSTSFTTASMPGGTRTINVAAMGTGGGIAEQEETDAKSGDVPSTQIHKMYNKLMSEVHDLYKKRKFKQIESKLEMMAILSRKM